MSRIRDNTVLLVEDTPSMAQVYEEYLLHDGYKVAVTDNGAGAIAWLDDHMPLAIVLDLLLPDINGLEVLRYARELYPKIPVIVVTANNSLDVAAQAVGMGAYDFIIKPVFAPRLSVTLQNALERKALVTEVAEWRQATGVDAFHNFIGSSAAMQAVYRVIDAVAPSRASVFINGENGTGKELAAQAVHNASPRASRPFVPLNCAAIPLDLMESTIFGHVKGAFTGAVSDNLGAARMAHGGTLFLDEVCEMPVELQTKLLRFLQTGEIMPVGGAKAEHVDLRIISATNRNPQEEMASRRFREDLFYRLHVVPVEMPPLREREDDVLLLASHFLARFNVEEGSSFTGLSPGVISLFRRYDWPGNVRQLENIIRNIVVLNEGPTVTESMLPRDMKRFSSECVWPANQNGNDELILADPDPSAIVQPLWRMEKDAIMKALDVTGQDITRAAAMLEVSPSTLYRKLQVWRRAEAVGA